MNPNGTIAESFKGVLDDIRVDCPAAAILVATNVGGLWVDDPYEDSALVSWDKAAPDKTYRLGRGAIVIYSPVVLARDRKRRGREMHLRIVPDSPGRFVLEYRRHTNQWSPLSITGTTDEIAAHIASAGPMTRSNFLLDWETIQAEPQPPQPDPAIAAAALAESTAFLPQEMRPRFLEIVGVIARVCAEHLDVEY